MNPIKRGISICLLFLISGIGLAQSGHEMKEELQELKSTTITLIIVWTSFKKW